MSSPRSNLRRLMIKKSGRRNNQPPPPPRNREQFLNISIKHDQKPLTLTRPKFLTLFSFNNETFFKIKPNVSIFENEYYYLQIITNYLQQFQINFTSSKRLEMIGQFVGKPQVLQNGLYMYVIRFKGKCKKEKDWISCQSRIMLSDMNGKIMSVSEKFQVVSMKSNKQILKGLWNIIKRQQNMIVGLKRKRGNGNSVPLKKRKFIEK